MTDETCDMKGVTGHMTDVTCHMTLVIVITSEMTCDRSTGSM